MVLGGALERNSFSKPQLSILKIGNQSLDIYEVLNYLSSIFRNPRKHFFFL